MDLNLDFKNKDFEILNRKEWEPFIDKEKCRVENYTYTDKLGKRLCSYTKLVNREFGDFLFLEDILIGSIVKGTELYEKLATKYISQLETIDLEENIFQTYKPPLIYNLDGIQQSSSKNKERSIFFVTSECKADYLIKNGLIATTVLDIEHQELKKIDSNLLKGKNIYVFYKFLLKDLEFLKQFGCNIKLLGYKEDFIKEFGDDNKIYKIVRGFKEYLIGLEKVKLLADKKTMDFLKDNEKNGG